MLPPREPFISPTKGAFEDDFPFLQVGYVSSLERIVYSICGSWFFSFYLFIFGFLLFLVFFGGVVQAVSIYIYTYTVHIYPWIENKQTKRPFCLVPKFKRHCFNGMGIKAGKMFVSHVSRLGDRWLRLKVVGKV